MQFALRGVYVFWSAGPWQHWERLVFVDEFIENLWRSHDGVGLDRVDFVVASNVGGRALALNQILERGKIEI